MRAPRVKVLVTGGAGFIGSHLCERLVARGAHVVALDDLSTGRRSNLATLEGSPAFRLVEGDVRDAGLVDELAVGAARVFHLAAVVGVRLVLERPERTVETIVEGTRNVLAASRRHGARLLLASSSEVYGQSPSLPFHEDDVLLRGATDEPRWVYACSKELGERLAFAQARRGLEVVVIRLFNTVGPRQRACFGMVLPNFLRQALADEPITVFGDGTQTRTFVHVLDTVDACVSLMEATSALGRVFNVGGVEEISVAELARMVKRATGSSSPIVRIPYREAYGQAVPDPNRRRPDIARLVEQTGFQPRAGIEEIVRELAGAPARVLAG